MNPDLKAIYDDMNEYVNEHGLLGFNVNMRVEDGIFIKVYVNDEGGIKGTFTKPLMNVYFSAPGILTVKFLLENRQKYGELIGQFPMRPIEKDTYRIDFPSLEKFELFIGSI